MTSIDETCGDAPIRIAIADDQDLVRKGFRLILSSFPGIEVVGEAVDGADAVFPEQLFPFGGGEVVFQYAFVAVEGDHLAGLFVQRHLLQQVFDACFERGGGVFVHVFHSVFVEVYPTFAVHFTFHRLVGCRCFGRLLCAEQCASSKQQG